MKTKNGTRKTVNTWRTLTVAAFVVFCFLSSPLRSQDIHFSQTDFNPILLNPAYSGFFDGAGRFGLSYRNQWASVSKAFQTIAATAEIPVVRRRYNHDGISIGAIIYNDRAGTLNYGTTAGNFILSYYKALSNSNDNFLSVAAEAGFGQAGFRTDNIELVDPSDDIQSNSATFLTIGAGIAWFYQPNDDFYLKLGLSGRNLNQPDISYLGLNDEKLYRKFNVYARCEYRNGGNLGLLPLATVTVQNKYMEAMVGCDTKYYLSESSDHYVSIGAGLHYRWRDAALVQFSLEYNSFIFALLYDANLSKLTPASKSIGSFEMNIVYRLVRNHRVNRKAMPCPII